MALLPDRRVVFAHGRQSEGIDVVVVVAEESVGIVLGGRGQIVGRLGLGHVDIRIRAGIHVLDGGGHLVALDVVIEGVRMAYAGFGIFVKGEISAVRKSQRQIGRRDGGVDVSPTLAVRLWLTEALGE